MLILDFVILAKVSFVLYELFTMYHLPLDASLGKKSVCFHVNAMKMSL